MTRRVIELKEWGTRDVRLEDADVAGLIAHPQHPAVVEPSPARGFWRLRAQAKVGAVRFEGFDLIVRPKAGLQNVFYLMGIERPRDWWSNDEVDLLVLGRRRLHLVVPVSRSFLSPARDRGLAWWHRRAASVRGHPQINY